MKKVMKWLTDGLGFEKQSKYVDEYFFRANMRASIYMSVVVIVIEIWMIIRLTNTIFANNLQGNFMHYFEKYYINYIVLLASGILMLSYSQAYIRGKTNNHILGQCIKWVFTFVCIYFGIKVSINDYSKGEQILTFLTMELFSMCLLTWKPITAFILSGGSYLYFFLRMNEMVAVNSGKVGTTLATQINFLTMWISTMMVCVANYNNTRLQAQKDENLEQINAYLSKISLEKSILYPLLNTS